jgi:cobaltochelatase CobN
MFHRRTWRRVARQLAETGIILRLVPQTAAETVLDEARGKIDLLIVDLSTGGTLPSGWEAASHRLSLSALGDAAGGAASAFTTFDTETVAEFGQYLAAVSLTNYRNGICFLAARSGQEIPYDPPVRVTTTGIYHPQAEGIFAQAPDYRDWYRRRRPDRQPVWVGLLCYHSQIAEENTADLDALIPALEAHGLAPVCVFSEGAEGADGRAADGPPWLAFLKDMESPGPQAILSLMGGRLLKTTAETPLLEGLDLPLIQLLRAHTQTPDQWRADPRGLPAMSVVYSFAQPETFGAAAPVLVAASEGSEAPSVSGRRFVPMAERIDTLCRRVARWVGLRQMANRDKRITFVLHNAPCKGVEATVGAAVGLDSFESLARVLTAMGAAGYDVGSAPATGKEILAEIMERKALSEFRWTTVAEIMAKGGALALMGAEDYEPWFEGLPSAARDKVLADWGPFPGEGMAARHEGRQVLVITGIQYGKVRIMVQPKRGCYGPKCTGEVCRILHDPQLAPPHHWLATYKFIQEHSDAVVHVGTEGALEFLPGKQNALGDACFPEISLGDLPNLYLYVMDATGEGVIAKRRGQAVLVDHLTPVYRPAPLDGAMERLEPLLEAYQRAVLTGEESRRVVMAQKIAPLLVACGLAETTPSETALPALIDTARRRINAIRQTLMPEGLHTLGAPPGPAGRSRMLAHLLQTPPPGLPTLAEIAGWCPPEAEGRSTYGRATAFLETLLGEGEGETDEIPAESSDRQALASFCRDLDHRLEGCKAEIDQLLRGLSGGFIAPGLSGSLSRGKVAALPTGRNFYATDVTCLPTPAAWEVGRRMADDLLRKYLAEEERFPESVGISIWSSDAFKSDGELLCQILALLGVRPVWDQQGRVARLEPIDLGALVLEMADGGRRARPRVDVTVQTSGIMRDLVPNFLDLMDRAVILVSELDEPEARNFIRKHSRDQLASLRQETAAAISEARLRRLATVRVFSSAPGSYGLGVGLALDASAWETAADLAEIYVNWGGHAYAAGAVANAVANAVAAEDGDAHAPAYGDAARQLLAHQLARLDVAYMQQASAEYDLLDCGCYAVFQGGMATAAAAVGAKAPKLYWGTRPAGAATAVADLSTEIERAAHAKLLNPAWRAHQRRHGFQGAQAVAGRVNSLFQWSATSGRVPKVLFDKVAETYVADAHQRDWLRKENPYALEEIVRRLLEAAARGMWVADEGLLERVRHAALEIEGDMEETMGAAAGGSKDGDIQVGEFQGGKVEVLTAREVDKWSLDWHLPPRAETGDGPALPDGESDPQT